MKKSLYILSAVLLLMLGSCAKEADHAIVGQWNLTDMELHTKSAQIGDQTIDVYIDFKKDGTYEMYQMIGQGRYQYFKGAYKIAGELLSGNYIELNSIRNWGNSYNIQVNKDELIMTATINSSDVYNYTRCTIPEDVIRQAKL